MGADRPNSSRPPPLPTTGRNRRQRPRPQSSSPGGRSLSSVVALALVFALAVLSCPLRHQPANFPPTVRHHERHQRHRQPEGQHGGLAIAVSAAGCGYGVRAVRAGLVVIVAQHGAGRGHRGPRHRGHRRHPGRHPDRTSRRRGRVRDQGHLRRRDHFDRIHRVVGPHPRHRRAGGEPTAGSDRAGRARA